MHSEKEKQIVVFKIGGEELAVDISEISEIIKPEKITPLPNTDENIIGIINLQNNITVIMNLAKKLNMVSKNTGVNKRIIVINVDNNHVGMIVDSITEILRINAKNIKPTPEIIQKEIASHYISGVALTEKRIIIILELSKIVTAEDIKCVNKIIEAASQKQNSLGVHMNAYA